MQRYIPIALVALLALWLLYPTVEWQFKDDRARIEYAVNGIIEGARKRHAGDIIRWVSEDYAGDSYHNNRQDVHETLQRFVFMFTAVQVDVREVTITMDKEDPDRATVLLHAPVLVARRGNREPDDPFVERMWGSNRFRLVFQREGSVWRVVEAHKPEATANGTP